MNLFQQTNVPRFQIFFYCKVNYIRTSTYQKQKVERESLTIHGNMISFDFLLQTTIVI